ncbi:hypothetical protein F7734_17300 [Scytonema sp. UIC 10036]|uniref:hypothetical protein n=1 Tax=Scytonema sp. UIC 10036 TaxID=2304196 RepID=UPI0012DA2BB5|nr:hypothetical protein [Scytonema sp. UIC 10036]MUG94051.1 hypothetical protein [Scytonema sp. UIC 10036]
MTHYLELTSKELASSSAHARQERRQLLKVFWLIALGLFVFELFWTETNSFATHFGAILITVAALVPTYLWCSGRALGIPIFPLFALTFTWTHALPLIGKHPIVITYSPENHLFASYTVVGFLGIGTFIWFQYVKSAPLPPQSYRTINSQKGDGFFLWVLAAGVLFNMNFLGGWLVLDGGVFAILRGVILGLTALSTFVLAYNLGTQKLAKGQAQWFLVLLIAHMVSNAASLLLVASASTFLIATLAFIIGSKKIPVLPILIILICLSLLHTGKDEMRAKYWGQVSVQPWDYPSWFAEWVGYSLENVGKENSSPQSQQQEASFLERSSVIHMLLLTQDQSPDRVPFLDGKTYEILPQVIVPRILNTNKIWTHEGTYLLNIHYGIQTREQTLTTTIGWGLLAESYANFGVLGCAGLAIVLGVVYGQSTRWCLNTPILSDRSLFAVLIMTFAFQSEWTAGVYVSALFQSSVALGGIVVFLMKTYKMPSQPVLTHKA